MMMPAGGGQNSRRICCSGDTAGRHAQPRRHQKSGQFSVRTRDKKYRSTLRETKDSVMPRRAHQARPRLGSPQSRMSKSGHILVRTPPLKFASHHTLTAPILSAQKGGMEAPGAICGLRKSGQFSGRTHVRKMRQNPRKNRGMSGDLNSGGCALISVAAGPERTGKPGLFAVDDGRGDLGAV